MTAAQVRSLERAHEMAITYRPNARKQWVLLGCSSALAVDLGLFLWARESLSSRDIILLSATAFFALASLKLFTGIILGVPRLTLDGQGVVLRSMFGSKSARWHRLGAFTLVTSSAKHGAPVVSASAPLVGPSGVAGKPDRQFTIPNAFKVPLPAIVADLAIGRGQAQGMLAPPRETRMRERPMGVGAFVFPWLTITLAAVFVIVFLAEQNLAVTPGPTPSSPSVATLIAMGGLSRPLILSGEWYRLFTAPFLHGNLTHLVSNGIAFLLGGIALEYLVGRIWLGCIFAGGALAGSLMSMQLIGEKTVSVGASGAIVAMLATLFLISFRLPPGKGKTHIQIQAARVVVPAVIPAHQAGAAMIVDYGAHFGGALFGVALGFLLLRTWADDAGLPPRGTVTLFAVMVSAVAFVGGAGAVAWHYPVVAETAQLIPRTMLPRDPKDMSAKADGLVTAYPRDPRGYLYQGVARLQRQDLRGAEQAFLVALPLLKENEPVLGRSLTNTAQAGLAVAIFGQGRTLEAKTIARAPCEATGEAAAESKIVANLVKFELCDAAGPAPKR
jgi:rhomboid protease GluP